MGNEPMKRDRFTLTQILRDELMNYDQFPKVLVTIHPFNWISHTEIYSQFGLHDIYICRSYINENDIMYE